MNSLTKKEHKELGFKVGLTWRSFEKFRQEGAKALESIKDGIVGILHTKTGQYRILEERDFQKLYGLARDVDRLQGGLRIVVSAARALKKDPDNPDTMDVLLQSITFLGSLPELPTREKFEPLLVETTELDEDDEVILNSKELEKLIKSESLTQEKH
ncbi:hypothetical protein DSM106972_032060 [Dulcicalothrix desertica PCC 7102]|uniref:Uncharacterized protein n=1 Tax=Dulcicalothrix desertica PCC 7102 TaxID=232991 RepID=A0A3S1CEX8_9CYAN|nr:hypothetical protein [Dulcicalothrix desertica]RUT06000.1 hypothetical protein DSM106972_032060 [Dulcicalothrix desertica PCC 7102]